MNILAKELNNKIKGSTLEKVLSEKAKKFYFPKGIIFQSQEAKKLATNINATIGAGLENGKTMIFPSVKNMICSLSESEIVSYSPTAGVPSVRKSWLADMKKKNPSLENIEVSLPMVTSGLTHTINLAAQMFVNPGDNIVYPDFFWGNYNLIFNESLESKIKNFSLFDENRKFNFKSLKETLDSYNDDEKVILILNFPNNPTGFSPTKIDAKNIVDLLSKESERLNLVIITDDAYFGLFYKEDTCKESLFSLLAKENKDYILVKGDASTKEYLAWGFRVGFITYWVKDNQEESYNVLIQKTMGILRSQISSCCTLTQNILNTLLNDNKLEKEKQRVFDVMKNRYKLITKALDKYKDDNILIPLPYNSGYFLTLESKVNNEKLRKKLLNDDHVGIISIKDKYIRIAFSSVDVENIEPLIDIIFKEAHSCI